MDNKFALSYRDLNDTIDWKIGLDQVMENDGDMHSRENGELKEGEAMKKDSAS